MWTELHLKASKDASYSDLRTQHRKQHTTATVHPGKASQWHQTMPVCLFPRRAMGWTLEQLSRKCFRTRRSLSPLLPTLSSLPYIRRPKDAYLLPFSVLVQHDHHQPGVHLIAFLSEGQVFAIPCHVDHKSRERERERDKLQGRMQEVSKKRVEATISVTLRKYKPIAASSCYLWNYLSAPICKFP